MKKLLLSIVSALFLCSCSNENESLENQDVQQEEQQITSTLLVDYQIPEQDIYYLQKLGFAGSSAQVFESFDPSSNEVYISYLLEGDIELKADELTSHLPEEALEKGGGLTSQYRTTVIANPNIYTLAIYSYPLLYGNNFTGIQNAVANYNNLNIGISFNLIQATSAGSRKNCNNDPNCIKIISSSAGGGSAGFPKNNGSPHDYIRINQSLGSANVVEHVVTHELGHCIGLRHTDWFDRQCINTPGNEGQTQYGAVHIPGTPATVNIDVNSIMMACYNTTTVDTVTFGEFTNFDIIALEELW